ncbi:DUF1540 domain-containing protein [Gulosibacter sp. 10]|uniref:DUF1540 domain-containing protein n=1 Tax=Gulosibacter sp. 10 TaxID=1255570 RepID=UPI00097EC9C1|nr:DUF1540 domain-containing protein [Gulosibacter sp. 10]SJM70600.1 hypothetical protein FM112_15390 [Gulosibacter sp. 10]
MNELTTISSCDATACAFNHNGCTAPAITMSRDGNRAACGTFISLDADGGLPTADAHVGACQMTECVHNKNLMCTAATISVRGNSAECSNFEVSAEIAA